MMTEETKKKIYAAIVLLQELKAFRARIDLYNIDAVTFNAARACLRGGIQHVSAGLRVRTDEELKAIQEEGRALGWSIQKS